MFKVIIADDEVIEIEYLHKMFQKHSEEFQITGIASNGEDALKISRRNKAGCGYFRYLYARKELDLKRQRRSKKDFLIHVLF